MNKYKVEAYLESEPIHISITFEVEAGNIDTAREIAKEKVFDEHTEWFEEEPNELNWSKSRLSVEEGEVLEQQDSGGL